MNFKKWSQFFLCLTEKWRKKVVQESLEGIKRFKKGEITPEGQELYKYLKSSEVELIGVCSFINYMRVEEYEKGRGDLDVHFEHPFSLPTLLYKVKGKPFLLLANANMDYNKSRLDEIKGNEHIKVGKDIQGIVG